MNKKKTEQQNKLILAALILCIIMIAAYRILLIYGYASKYIDDDQALMWYGTALAAHKGLWEPHFLGQMYGSMLESILAVPLYKVGVPLEWALPLSTFFIWFLPFVLLALLCRKKVPVISFGILLSSMLYHWDYDILTSIPRSFIAGFPLAFIGLGLITTEKKQKPLTLFLAIVFMGVAYSNTVTTIAISALGILYLLLYNRSWIKRDWWALLAGIVVVVPSLYYLDNYFYKAHPDYWIYGKAETVKLSWEVFQSNIEQFGKLLCSFSLVNYHEIPISFFVYTLIVAVIVGLLVKRKDYKFIFVILCAIVGSVSFLFVERTKLYDDSLFYSATRLYLYFPYVIIAVLFLFARKCNFRKNTKIKLPIFKKHAIKQIQLCTVLILAIAAVCTFKIYRFETKVVNYSQLYEKSTIINVSYVKDVYKLADELSDFAKENDTDILISLDYYNVDGVIYPHYYNIYVDYATSAINYDKYTEYRAYFDRRTDVYLKLKQRKLHNENVGFVDFKDNHINNSHVEVLDDTDCVSYIEKKTGLYRSETKVE